jgi:hypothetical protein
MIISVISVLLLPALRKRSEYESARARVCGAA